MRRIGAFIFEGGLGFESGISGPKFWENCRGWFFRTGGPVCEPSSRRPQVECARHGLASRVRAGELAAITHDYPRGPVGLDNIAASIGEERDTIEDVLEPYLIQQGFVQRTPRGRVATAHAWQHFGLAMPAGRTPELWDPRGE